VTSFLASYGQWALAVTGVASAFFVFAATFLEYTGRKRFLFRGVRFRSFRWWHHELTAAQVMLDLGLGVVLLPSSLYILFHISILNRVSDTSISMWYYALGLTYVAAVTIWRADATMRAKARERQQVKDEKRRAPLEDSPTGQE
jgi:hypothetical protein